jgi:hypothetical protein
MLSIFLLFSAFFDRFAIFVSTKPIFYHHLSPKFSQISYLNMEIDQFLPKMSLFYSKFNLKIVSDNRGRNIKKKNYNS